MKVYIVISTEDKTIEGVFSSSKKAKDHADELIEYTGDENCVEIEEKEVL